MSTVHFIGLRCDGCKEGLRDGADGIFFDRTKPLRQLAKHRGWRCRAWTTDRGQVDACPACTAKMNWGSPLSK